MSGPPVLTVDCPDCGDKIPVPVTIEVTGKSDDRILQIAVLPDRTEVWSHSLTCRGAAE